jgi:hypothetical protein
MNSLFLHARVLRDAFTKPLPSNGYTHYTIINIEPRQHCYKSYTYLYVNMGVHILKVIQAATILK